MNGGRKKWEHEDHPLATALPTITPPRYQAQEPDPRWRAFQRQVLAYVRAPAEKKVLVDVRSPAEFSRDHPRERRDGLLSVGERSAPTWFVLSELLGYPRVRNYDGSWTEWRSIIGTPIANPAVEC
jgi:thiosulfate/3-mercaptopyruvate sulfurtransferase